MPTRSNLTGLRHRVLLPLLAIALLLGTVPAEASDRGTIVIEGVGNRSVLVHLREHITLEGDPFALVPGERAWGRLETSFVGYAITSISNGRVVAGRIRSDFYERALGKTSALMLGMGRDQELRPGRYRFTLLGNGAQRVVVRNTSSRKHLRLRVSQAARVRFEAGALIPSRGPLTERRTAVTLVPSTFLYYGIAGNGSPMGLSCFNLTQGDAKPTCFTAPAGDGGTVGAGGASATAWRHQPGEQSSGRWQVLWQALPLGDGAAFGSVLFTLG